MRQFNSGLNQRSHFYFDNKKSKLSFGRKTSVLSQKKCSHTKTSTECDWMTLLLTFTLYNQTYFAYLTLSQSSMRYLK